MKLSVIIVNYNVRAYLEQCLRTVFTALEDIDGEVFVVDNLSTDGSVEMVQRKFPEVKLIANRSNVGFSRANNQAIRISNGEYVLLLNPDTVVGENVFKRVITFMDGRPKAGGLGVKMIDGTGRFLPESKRGLPTPKVAFFKIIGLTRLFPRSRVFGRYHLGHLPENEAAPIEILSGACMFLRRKTLDEVGLLDENFFMYGEDIDLSYRITLAGYENWYFPDARIIHYKGESTKKSSVNYVFVFYNAMAIFARKHFTQRTAAIFPLLINGSIYLSAAAAIAVRFLDRTMLPMLDFLAVIALLALSPIVPERWPMIQVLGADLLIASVVVAWMAFFGGYDRPIRMGRPVKAMACFLFIALLIISILGASHGTMLASIWAFSGATGAFVLVRSLLHAFRMNGMGIRRKERERILAIGSPDPSRKALALLWQTHYGLGYTEVIDPALPEADPDKLPALIRANKIGEVIFCARDMAWDRIILLMESARDTLAVFKIAQPDTEFIIGPNSIESLSDLDLLEGHALNDPMARRNKRIIDVAIALLLLLSLPLSAWFVRRPAVLVNNCVSVLKGEKSWVGYHPTATRPSRLPAIPRGILDPMTGQEEHPDELAIARANLMYAKDHSPRQDLGYILRGLRTLGGG